MYTDLLLIYAFLLFSEAR